MNISTQVVADLGATPPAPLTIKETGLSEQFLLDLGNIVDAGPAAACSER